MSKSRGALFLLLSFYFCSVILPVLLMVLRIDWSTVSALAKSPQLKTALVNSVLLTSFVTAVVVPSALLFAWAICRQIFPFRSSFIVLFSVPMLIPSISHGMGLVNVFGSNGIITNFIGFDIGLYGFNGIAMGSIIYSFPVAYLMFADAIHYMDGQIYDGADILGIPPLKTFVFITLPCLSRTIVSAGLAVFTMVFTDYGVPLAVGGRYSTLPVFLYKEVIGRLDFSKGAFVGLILITPALIAFVLDVMKGDSDTSFSRRTMRAKPSKLSWISFFSCAVMTVFLCLPIFSFITQSLSLSHFRFVLQNGLLSAAKNSVLAALFAAVFGTVIAYITAYFTARTEKTISKRALHFLSVASVAIPGIVLGLGYIITFKGSLIYGTLFLLVLVNIVHFLAAPYLMAYNALHKLNANLESVGETLGVPRFSLFLNVIVPSSFHTILEMGSYFFINSMITISAVAFLFTVRTKPMSMLIPQFESSLAFEAVAVVSLSILIINLICKWLIAKWNGAL